MTEQLENALYIVGTPIGNLEDISLRAIRILEAVDLIAAEDTRHTGKLLQHLQITTPQISYHEHNRQQRQGELLQRLQEGQKVALVTDAGMPGISDPGSELVQVCVENGVRVIPIPGATAVITALAAAGLPSNRFVFEGFLPVKGKERQARLKLLERETRTIIIYESPHRLRQTLRDLADLWVQNKQVVLARELTKLHEEFWRGNLEAAINLYHKDRQPQGEYTLVIEGTQEEEKLLLSPAQIKAEMEQLLQQGMTRSQASRQLASLTNISRREIYQLSMDE